MKMLYFRYIFQLLDDNRDLYVSQDTWNGYESMLRYLKKYDLKFSYNKIRKTGTFLGNIILHIGIILSVLKIFFLALCDSGFCPHSETVQLKIIKITFRTTYSWKYYDFFIVSW